MIDRELYFRKRDPLAFPIWQKAKVGIAGAGGLGSNIAVSLARAGIGTLVIADLDIVSLENLNRQQFVLEQVGLPKVLALAANLKAFNPFIELVPHYDKVTPANLPELFGDCDLLLEAFDNADQKTMLIETWTAIYPHKHIIAASGLSGYGKGELIKIEHFGYLHIVGDGQSELQEGISPIAPRVAIVANLQANLALELLVKNYE
jgi:sulfur carrier protein ThiS adenylyltransferase